MSAPLWIATPDEADALTAYAFAKEAALEAMRGQDSEALDAACALLSAAAQALSAAHGARQ